MPTKRFIEIFGPGPLELAKAPGRVNLIGDHTDYNGGYVFPMAINRDVRIACRASDDQRVELVSLDFDERHAFGLDAIKKDSGPGWANYFMGVAHVLRQEGHALRGLRGVIKGNVPIGSGLSSSAALEVASAMALCATSDLKINREQLSHICRRAENEFVGVNCGIMDQFASLLCRKNCALRIDCTSLSYETIPFDDAQARVVVCNSGVKHALVDSPYNQRRRECAAAFEILHAQLPGIKTFRDVKVKTLQGLAHMLPEPLNRRARHVVTENIRVLYAVQALQRGDLIGFGALMDASHDSLKNDFEVSCLELDLLVDLARQYHGTYGARLTGAGFGGCIVALVRPDTVTGFVKSVSDGYAEQTGHTPETYVFRPSKGATVERIENP